MFLKIDPTSVKQHQHFF